MLIFSQNISKEVANNQDGQTKNELVCQGFTTYFERTWAPILPLWTALILNLVKNDVVFNNQSIESWFGALKNRNLKNPKRWAYHDYLKEIKELYR